MIERFARLLEKAERLLDVRIQIAEHDLKMRKAYPLPVDFYVTRTTDRTAPFHPDEFKVTC
jgi:hypothetical protein